MSEAVNPQENALPVEMVEAAAKALFGERNPAGRELLRTATAALTAAGVPALLEEVERLRRALEAIRDNGAGREAVLLAAAALSQEEPK